LQAKFHYEDKNDKQKVTNVTFELLKPSVLQPECEFDASSVVEFKRSLIENREISLTFYKEKNIRPLNLIFSSAFKVYQFMELYNFSEASAQQRL